MLYLALLFGGLMGVFLGLTGGGGGIFSVPLLVYGLQVEPTAAVAISMAAVAATGFVGVVTRVPRREVEFPTGLLFALAGMVSAPLGVWLARQLPSGLLLSLFALLMLAVAYSLWRKASAVPSQSAVDEDRGPTCRRDPAGKLRLTSSCAGLLAGVGLLVGLLSGMFGVGGGFLIVPALVVFSGMGLRRAVGTSLLIMTLVSCTGLASHWAAGLALDFRLLALFTGGGVAGMLAAGIWGQRLPERILLRVFSLVIVGVASFILLRGLWDLR